jgi:hypothetical protein
MLKPIVFTPYISSLAKPKCTCSILKGKGYGDCKCGWDVGGGYPLKK